MRQISVAMPGLHPRQHEVAEHPARFRVLACGRRWGKTRLGAALCIAVALRGGRAWWVAPSYPISTVGWRLIKRLGGQVPNSDKREVERMIEFPGNGWVQVRSAHDPDSLRGEGLDFLVMDECAFIREDAWREALRPALSDRQGRAMFISTPKGQNWFWRLWQRCQDPAQGEWHGWQLPTADNPFIAPEEIAAARQSLPERIFRQEYLAEFIDDAGGVFRRVMEAATAEWQDEARRGTQYVMGVDWAKHNDFTVLTVIDVRRRAVCHIDRFNQIDYAVQTQRLKTLAGRFGVAQVIAESNSMGEPLIEQLQRDGLPVVPFQTTNSTKAAAIEALALAFEQGALSIPNEPVLIGELQAYELDRTPSGMVRYGAPEGMHDDCVMSLALAWQGVTLAPGIIPEQPAQPSRWGVAQEASERSWRKY